ncbi:hypothetical protein GCM10022227_03160 [Streptomyces sedi]
MNYASNPTPAQGRGELREQPHAGRQSTTRPPGTARWSSAPRHERTAQFLAPPSRPPAVEVARATPRRAVLDNAPPPPRTVVAPPQTTSVPVQLQSGKGQSRASMDKRALIPSHTTTQPNIYASVV